MLGGRVCVRTVTGLGSTTFSDQSRSSSSSWAPKPNALRLSSPFRFGSKRCRNNNNNNSSQIQSQSMLIVSCKSSQGRFGGRSGNAHDRNHHDFLEASLLLSGPFSLSLSLSNNVEVDSVRFEFNYFMCIIWTIKYLYL